MNLSAIQQQLTQAGVDGWLFFDHHGRDPLAYRVLGFTPRQTCTRRWYYFIPAQGDPVKLVHRIESHVLDSLPGRKESYAGWQMQLSSLKAAIGSAKRIVMQYSPNCAIPYVSMVDGGTVELVRSLGVEVVSSADLIQVFEATWTDQQFDQHRRAGEKVDRVRRAAFELIRTHLTAGTPVDEFTVKSFILESFDREGLITDHGPIVGVNGNASDPHYEPFSESAHPIRKNDFVLIDLWAKLKEPGAVFYDITWTGYCGKTVPEPIQKIFTIVSGARDTAVQAVQSAISSRKAIHGFEVDDAARGFIEKNGYGEYFFHRTGHSIGEDIHGTGANMDNLETHDERLVVPRTCFSIEPGIYLPEFGIRSEVNVYVRESDAIVTGEIQREVVRILG